MEGIGKKIHARLERPNLIFLDVLGRFSHNMSDEIYLKWRFFFETGHRLNLGRPESFNQKLQWLKLNSREDWLTNMVDKYKAKQIVAEKIGNEYIIPTYARWDNPDKLIIDDLPQSFVLKTNHDSGGVVICKDKRDFDLENAQSILRKSYHRDYYMAGREWPYKNIKRCVFAEKYISDSNGELYDYKFFCFNGKVRFLKVDFDRWTEHHANYYSPEWKLLPFGEASFPPNPDKNVIRPANLEEMVRLAETLAENIPFVRIDFYDIDGKIYFGEFTLYPASGFGKFTPARYDRLIGEMLILPENNG